MQDSVTGREGPTTTENGTVFLTTHSWDETRQTPTWSRRAIHECNAPYAYKHGADLRCYNPGGHGDILLLAGFGDDNDVALLAAKVARRKSQSDASITEFQNWVHAEIGRQGAEVIEEGYLMDGTWRVKVILADGRLFGMDVPLDMPPEFVKDAVTAWLRI